MRNGPSFGFRSPTRTRLLGEFMRNGKKAFLILAVTILMIATFEVLSLVRSRMAANDRLLRTATEYSVPAGVHTQ
jgi:hypothetical protein